MMSSEIITQNGNDPGLHRKEPIYRKSFINRFGNLRAIWRITGYLLVALGLGSIFEGITELIPTPDEGKTLITWSALVGRSGAVAAMILAGYVMLKWVDKRPFQLLGISPAGRWKRDLGLGLVVGSAMLTVTLAILWAGDWVALSLNDLTLFLAGSLFKALLLFSVAALMEELLLRGYPFQALIEGSRPWIATILLSSIFSIMHMNNPSATVPSAINIFLAGVLFSVCYLKTRSLWFPTGLHIGWNWMQASFWGMGVSGFHVKWSVFAAVPNGAEWISGGKFGAEASIFATVILATAIYAIWSTERLDPNPETIDLWSRYPKSFNQMPEQP